MMKTPAEFATLEVTIGHWIRFVGGGIEIFGVLVIVLGIVWSIYLFLASTRRWAVLRGLQNPHWPIPTAWPRGSCRRRYRENHRPRLDLSQSRAARGPSAGPHLSELDLGSRNRRPWPWQRKRLWPSRARAFESIGERTAGSDVREYRPPHRRLSTQEPIGISTAGSVRGLIDSANLDSAPNEGC